MKKQKQCALLLEVVIALGLVLLCLFPLLRPHLAIRKELLKQAEERQLERSAKEAAIDIKTRLYEHHYSWKQLRAGVKEDLSKTVLGYNTQFKLKKLRHYTRYHDGAHFLFMKLEIIFKRGNVEKQPYIFHLFLEEKKG